MIRIGLIGCGEHSKIGHATPLARYRDKNSGQVELTAACDVKRERAESFCREYGFLNAYDDVDQMLTRHKLDGCISVVPVEAVSRLGIKLLELGVPCVAEKPLGSSLLEVNSLLEAAGTTGTPNMVSVNRRFMPVLRQAIDWTRSSGTVRYVRCLMTRHARKEPEFLWTTAVHAVDTLRHLGGEVAEARIQTFPGTNESGEWYAIDLRFESGTCGRIDVLPTSGVREETYELIGEGFRAVVTCPFGPWLGWRAFRDDRLVAEEAASNVPEDVYNGCYDEAAEFIKAILDHRSPRPSIKEVFPSVKLCYELAAQRDRKYGNLAVVQS